MGLHKHKPQRMCAACRNSFDKSSLVRLTRTIDDKIELDKFHKLPGRGAYLCLRIECLELALKRRQMERALKAALTQETAHELKAWIERG